MRNDIDYFLREFSHKKRKEIASQITEEYEWIRFFSEMTARKKEDGSNHFSHMSMKVHWGHLVDNYKRLIPEEKQKEMERLKERYNVYRRLLDQQERPFFVLQGGKINFLSFNFKPTANKSPLTTRLTQEYREKIIEKEFLATNYGALEKQWRLKKMFLEKIELEFQDKICKEMIKKIRSEIEEMVDYLNDKIGEKIERIEKVIGYKTPSISFTDKWLKYF